MAKKDEEKRSGGFGYTDDSGSRVSAFRDMFDGGGAGRSGASFEGSPLSTFGNALGIRPAGSDRPNPRQSAGFGDFFDGGGYGRSGQRFSGSGYSILANALGIKPMGYEQRMAAAQPQMRPAPSVVQTGFVPQPVVTPEVTATPLDPVGAMPLQDLLSMIEAGLIDAEGTDEFVNSRTNTQMHGDPLGREVNPLYVNYPFMRY